MPPSSPCPSRPSPPRLSFLFLSFLSVGLDDHQRVLVLPIIPKVPRRQVDLASVHCERWASGSTRRSAGAQPELYETLSRRHLSGKPEDHGGVANVPPITGVCGTTLISVPLAVGSKPTSFYADVRYSDDLCTRRLDPVAGLQKSSQRGAGGKSQTPTHRYSGNSRGPWCGYCSTVSPVIWEGAVVRYYHQGPLEVMEDAVLPSRSSRSR